MAFMIVLRETLALLAADLGENIGGTSRGLYVLRFYLIEMMRQLTAASLYGQVLG